MNLIITKPAEDDIINIISYISKDNKTAAEKMLSLFYKKFQNLSITPFIGRQRKFITNKDIRFLCIKKNYIIVYEVEQNNIVILRVLSTYQDIIRFL